MGSRVPIKRDLRSEKCRGAAEAACQENLWDKVVLQRYTVGFYAEIRVKGELGE
jgi:hypothetical protein